LLKTHNPAPMYQNVSVKVPVVVETEIPVETLVPVVVETEIPVETLVETKIMVEIAKSTAKEVHAQLAMEEEP